MDIDHFKKVNDEFGHAQGDLVLAQTGLKIRKNARPDDICVRYGGEEFVAVTLSSNADTPVLLAERICQAVNSHIFQHGQQEFSITLSVGIAFHRRDETIEQTINRADKLLYQAKAKGRNCIVQETDE